MDPGFLVLGFLWLMSRNKGESRGHSVETASSPSGLVNRATQSRAMAWAPYFQDVGEIPAVADALARWAGIESGGDPLAVSSLNERGLLQVGPQTIQEGGIDARDWDALIDPGTMPNTQAVLAAHYWRWLLLRAATHLAAPPPDVDPVGQVWFAYQYHQRPKDFTQWGQLPNNAAQASAYLLGRARLNSDANLLKRVTASNVVAWGLPDSPLAPMVGPLQITRVEVQAPDGTWLKGTLEPGGISATIDATGDSWAIGPGAHPFRPATS